MLLGPATQNLRKLGPILHHQERVEGLLPVMQWIKRLVIALLCLYVLICGLAYAFQERLIFHPRAVADDYVYDWGREVAVPVAGEVTLSTVWVDRPAERGVVLYFHGNVGDNNRGLYQMSRVMKLPYDLVFVDYRGFGKSGGVPESDAQLLADVQAVYDTVAAHYAEDQIHLLGYSLGTGLAAYLAAENRPGHLTLVAPYTSLHAMKDQVFWWLPGFLLKYQLATVDRIADVKCPVDIYHGTADELIPFTMAEELKRLSPKLVTLHPLKGVGHRGAILQMGLDWLE